LRRNAGLRLLVQASVKVGDEQLQHAFFLRYGARYETRLIVVKTLREATSVVGALKKGESFIDLATERSTDISRNQGGLLPPISPADQNYPQAVRAAVVKLKPGQISDPIALENGFAVLRLERKKEARNVQFDDVKEELRPLVRRRTERVHMQQLARELLTASDLVVLDRGLRGSWDQYRKTMEGK
jgi:parvulin-like peptidyl-prolyl isomerase